MIAGARSNLHNDMIPEEPDIHHPETGYCGGLCALIEHA